MEVCVPLFPFFKPSAQQPIMLSLLFTVFRDLELKSDDALLALYLVQGDNL